MLTIESVSALDTICLHRDSPRRMTLLEPVGVNLEEPFEETLLALFGYTRAFVPDRHRNARRGLCAILWSTNGVDTHSNGAVRLLITSSTR